jgi:hypothetical protein
MVRDGGRRGTPRTRDAVNLVSLRGNDARKKRASVGFQNSPWAE